MHLVRRSLLAFALAASGAGALWADDAPAADRAAVGAVSFKGVPVRYVPPSGDYEARRDAPAPGQSVATYRGAKGAVSMQALAFPVRPGPVPPISRVLHLAVDTAMRSEGVSGFGLSGAREISLWGMDGAEAGIQARRGDTTVRGRARILRASLTHWAFAWALAPSDHAAGRSAVRTFVDSLHPTEPTFFAPRFFDPGGLDDVVLEVAGEEPLRKRHLLAVARLTETALGGPMSMARRAQLHQVLLDDARQGTSTQRDAFRSAPGAFVAPPGMDAAERARRRLEIARALHRGYVMRGIDRDVPDPMSLVFLEVYDTAKRRVVGTREDGLRTRHVDALFEVVGFLGSLAADRPRGISTHEREALLKRVIACWPSLGEQAHAALGEMPRTWMRLRYLWDQASPAMRVAFRIRVLGALAAEGQAQAVATLRTPAELRAWHDSHPPSRPLAQVLEVLLRTEPSTWTTWLDALGDPSVLVPLGW